MSFHFSTADTQPSAGATSSVTGMSQQLSESLFDGIVNAGGSIVGEVADWLFQQNFSRRSKGPCCLPESNPTWKLPTQNGFVRCLQLGLNGLRLVFSQRFPLRHTLARTGKIGGIPVGGTTVAGSPKPCVSELAMSWSSKTSMLRTSNRACASSKSTRTASCLVGVIQKTSLRSTCTL